MLKTIYISRFWFYAFATGVILIVLGYYAVFLLYVGQFFLVVLLLLTFLDGLLIYSQKKPVEAKRFTEERLHLGDANEVKIFVKNTSNQFLRISVIDEPPYQMQAREMSFKTSLKAHEQTVFSYSFRPQKRGLYKWGNLYIFLKSAIGLLERRLQIEASKNCSVYPSVLQMKKFDFLMFNQQSELRGIKKIRRLGHHNEFEQIKNYVQGDDIRTINWKATSRTRELMVNQYQEQRAQSVYAIIDKSRSMEHEFEGMTLLDYAINSSLVFANIALRKSDKIGLITFSHKMGTQIAADSNRKQLQRILEALYTQKTAFKEAHFPLLYQAIRKKIASRSLLLLYTNFETELSMRRALPLLKQLNKKHVLVIVFFENTDLKDKFIKGYDTLREIYVYTLAEEIVNTKKRIALELKRNGIHTILTEPSKLNVDAINKYLELKSKGII